MTVASELDAGVCGRIWTSSVTERMLQRVCGDIGPHLAGSKGMADATEVVRAEMESGGAARVRTEPVSLPLWERGDASVEIDGVLHGDGEVLQFLLSPPADLTAPLVDVADGSSGELDLAGDRVAGAILLMRDSCGPGTTRIIGERTIAALEAGAQGAVVISREAAGLSMSGFDDGMDGRTIPTVGVTRRLEPRLVDAARHGSQVRMITSGSTHSVTCRNVVAEIGPDSGPMVILSAHLDGYDISPSASDNLSGVCCMLEMLSALAPCAPAFRRRLRFVAFTGEEIGFIGARSYVTDRADELDDIEFQFNMDSLFDDTADGIALFWARPALAYLRGVTADTGRPVKVVDFLGSSSDYVPFELAGVPTARPATFRAGFPDWHHTPGDTPDRVSPDEIRLNAMPYAQMALRLALADEPFPAPRLSRDQILAEIDRWGVREQWDRFAYLGLLRD